MDRSVNGNRRVFLGLTISDRNEEIVQSLQSKLESRIPRIRWIAQGNHHLTLKFIGEIEDSKVHEIIERLQDAPSSSFTATLGGIGRFPVRGRRLRVLQIPMISGIDETTRLSEMIHDRITHLGIPSKKERRYIPHLTIGRVRGGRPIVLEDDLDRYLKSVAIELNERFDSYELYESVLSQNGARYVVLSEFPLV